MSTDYTSKKFKKLLDKLQQDSWQLELLISGFSIFALISLFQWVKAPQQEALILGKLLKSNTLGVILTSCSILIFNLVLHLILRGLWIGGLGLRYVSGDVDFEILNYSNKFKEYLKKKIVSFDKYIATLENYCSILFAISFLLIFYIISFFIILFLIAGIFILVLDNEKLPEIPKNIIGFGLLFFLGLGTLLTMIDFFSQGFLKKKKKIAKIYFPFYWVFSYITLSFLYRPLVYNFLDNRFGKRISIFIVPIYIGIALLTSIEYKSSNYLSGDGINRSILMNHNNYDDLLVDENDLIESTTIQSKVIKDNFVKVFRVFDAKTEDRIFNYYTKLKPEEDDRGYRFKISFSSNDRKTNDSLSKKYVEIFNETHQIFIDSVRFHNDFLISENSKKQLGFETYINIKNLSEGKHVLTLKRIQKDDKDGLKTIDESIIPFWHYKP